jgi:hypothetical protein
MLPAHRAYELDRSQATTKTFPLLGEYRCDELGVAVQVQRTLDTDHDVVRGTECQCATPDQTGAVSLDDAPNRGQVEARLVTVSITSAVPAGDVIAATMSSAGHAGRREGGGRAGQTDDGTT